jgi:hypothetical protein
VSRPTLKRTVWCNRGWMPFYYGFCPSEAAWKRDMRLMKVKGEVPYPTSDGNCTTFVQNGKDLTCIVTINERLDGRNPSGIIGLIAHEAMHVWQALMEKIGERDPSQEFGAYSYQSIFQELLEAYVATRNPKMLVKRKRAA